MYMPKKYLFGIIIQILFSFDHLDSMHQASAYARYPDPVSQAGPR